MKCKLVETISFLSEKVTQEGEKHHIKDVVLLGSVSKNTLEGKPRRYLESTMKTTLPQFEGLQVNVNHSASRSILETLGVSKNPRIIEGKVVGDIELIDSQPGRHVALLAKHFPKIAGMSINGEGEFNVGEEYADVVKLDVSSVDAVANPGTTKGFFEDLSFSNYDIGGGINVHLDFTRLSKEELLKEVEKMTKFIKAISKFISIYKPEEMEEKAFSITPNFNFLEFKGVDVVRSGTFSRKEK